MRLVIQLVLYCLLFLLLVKLAVQDSGRNCLYFYPKDYLAEAERRGIANQAAVMKEAPRFMVPFCIVIFAAPVLVIAFWNHVTDFWTAYWQSVFLLVGMNWFDGIALDRVWVAHSKVWKIDGMEGVPYIKPWKTVLLKRGLGTVLYLVLALALAGLAVLLGNF